MAAREHERIRDRAVETTDEHLLARAREGDEEAFRRLFDRHAPSLRKRIRRRLPAALRRKVAESDVIQAAYLGVYRNIDQFEDRGDASFESWLAGIIDHKIGDVLRHYMQTARRDRRCEVSQGMRRRTHKFPAQQPTPSAHAIAAELEGRIREALPKLSPDHRQVIRLIQEEGLTHEQAGRRMGRSGEAVRKLYARAIARLAELAEADGEAE